MNSQHRAVRAGIVSALSIAAASSMIGLTASPAAAAPATPLQVEQTLLTGDPWPVSYQTFTANTAAPGQTRITVIKQCNSFNRGLCLPYTRGAQIAWLNTSTGRTGHAAIKDGAAPGTSVDLASGPGVIAVKITAAVPATLFPALGVVTTR